MRNVLLLLLITVFVCGCNYQTQIIAETQEKGEVELKDNPANISTNHDLFLTMLISNNKGEPARVSKSETTIEYMLGTATISSIEIRDGRIINKGEEITSEKFRNDEILGRGIRVFVPFPLTADSADVTMRIKSGGKWHERAVIVTKLIPETPEELKVEIISENETSTIPSGETVILKSTVTGGVPPYSYQWRNSSGITIGQNPELTIVDFNCTKEGLYMVTVTDANGKSAVS